MRVDSVNFARKNYTLNPVLKNSVQFNGIFSKKDTVTFSFNQTAFSAFNTVATKAGIKNVEDLERNIKGKNLIGEGANSLVYKFDDHALDSWVIKKDKKDKKVPYNAKNFVPTIDSFAGENLGQEIAWIGSRYHILKKVKGVAHSIPDWSKKIMEADPVDKRDARKFARSIHKIANFPQSSFDEYARKQKLLAERSYKQDSINPNNLIIDYKTKTINIIDFFKKEKGNRAHTDSYLDLSNCLLDFALYSKYYDKLHPKQQADFVKDSHSIIGKCFLAAEKQGISLKEKTYQDYINEVDKWFGFELPLGNYMDRYNEMKSILMRGDY